MRAKPFDRLTPSQEAVYSFVSKSSRWLTVYEIAMLTGVSKESARSSMRELLKMDFVETRKRIFGFDNGEREFHAKSKQRVAAMCAASNRRNQTDVITGVEPLTRRLRRILGRAKAQQFAEFIR